MSAAFAQTFSPRRRLTLRTPQALRQSPLPNPPERANSSPGPRSHWKKIGRNVTVQEPLTRVNRFKRTLSPRTAIAEPATALRANCLRSAKRSVLCQRFPQLIDHGIDLPPEMAEPLRIRPADFQIRLPRQHPTKAIFRPHPSVRS